MNVALDPTNGMPRWESSRVRYGPKEDFAYEAAVRLLNGKLTLDDLRDQIISAANRVWKKSGNGSELFTLKDVKAALGGSAKDWFHEIQRVAHSPEALFLLIDQKGKGLTALSRSVGPLQPQRAKGFASPKPSQKVKLLLDLLTELRVKLDECPDRELTRHVLREVRADRKKYSALLEKVRNDR